MKKTFPIALIFCCFGFHANSQKTVRYNSVELLNSNLLKTDTTNYYPWNKSRKENPLVYENSITPAPNPDEWFHATIVVQDDWIKVYVNHSPRPSLQIKSIALITLSTQNIKTTTENPVNKYIQNKNRKKLC